MKDLKDTIRPIAAGALLTVLGALTACNALDATQDPLLANTNTFSAADSGIPRVTVILHNLTAEPALVDMALDGFVVTYPVKPAQILSLRLKCADVFTFAEIRFPSLDPEGPPIPVNQQAARDLQYDCGDVLLINVHDEFPELEVVAVEPLDQ